MTRCKMLDGDKKVISRLKFGSKRTVICAFGLIYLFSSFSVGS